ncbi:acetolactate synthase 3 large subunit [Pleomorphomonas sp. NRKKF1]|uniref:acetolactate synthase 3 large subunit n=1 Tax=Pleomorphomonas sp. NRK KF1 TaxID=2943000 RepID=UPI002042F803|nr:acetolactate synthase 3 large subunit [Pleomorphomonas sp. NRK KF1]
MTGAEMVIQTLVDQGVDTIFGYPGSAVLPIFDELFQQEEVRHVLVRHEQGAGHAAEGYARSTGKVGVALVTSGPAIANMVTALADARADSIPMVCITGQVPTTLIGTDAFQEADTVGITRPCTKHNWLVRRIEDLPGILHEAFRIATTGRPGPVLVDIPKNIQFQTGTYENCKDKALTQYHPAVKAPDAAIREAVELMAAAKKPILYTGGGVINSGPKAVALLREFVKMTGFPITSTLMGLGAYPSSGKNWLGMLGMHGTFEANLAMHDCDVMVCIGARFDDRITGRIDAFSPNSKKIHIDIDPSSINKTVMVDLPVVGDVGQVIEDLIAAWTARKPVQDKAALAAWWKQIDAWRAKKCLAYRPSAEAIMPQYAIERLHALTRGRDTYITTEVGQHQMWVAQYYGFDQPNRLMTSGGLGTMGYGLPAAIGTQLAHPGSLVINVAGDASIQMNIRELSTAVQHNAPVKTFILNNQHLGMVRQWQKLFHGNRISHSTTDAQPDFVRLAEAYGAVGIRCSKPSELDDAIEEMIRIDRPVLFDCRVVNLAHCLPMIPAGKAHNEMLLGMDEENETVGGGADKVPA